MKLRNKKTGEIIDLVKGHICESISGESIVLKSNIASSESYTYNSFAELNEEWEDYEEPKQSALRFMILTLTNFIENEPSDNVDLEDCKEMLKRLEAMERLKDDDFKFECWYYDAEPIIDIKIRASLNESDKSTLSDLDLLFSGEDD